MRRESLRKPAFTEPLEPRRLLASIAWDGGGDGISWTDPANWYGNALPTAADDVTIDLAGSDPRIELGRGQVAVRNIVTSEDLLLLDGSTLQVFGDLTLLDAQITLEAAYIRFSKPGTALLDGSGGVDFAESGGAIFVNNSYLDTGKDLTIGAGIYTRVLAGAECRIVCTDMRRGKIINQGLIETSAAGGTLYLGAMPSTSVVVEFVNAGTLYARDGGAIQLAGSWASTGEIHVADATLRLSGKYDAASIERIRQTGISTVRLEGEISMSGGSLTLDDQTGSMTLGENGYLRGPGDLITLGSTRLYCIGGTLWDVTIRGTLVTQQYTTKTRGAFKLDGTLISTGGSIAPDGGWTLFVEVEDGATFSGADVRGTIAVSQPGSTVYFENGFSNGTVILSGAGARAIATGTQTVRGTFQFDSDATTSLLIRNAAPDVPAILTFGGTIRGRNGLVADHPSNSFPATLLNTNRLEADRAGMDVTIAPGILTNNGIASARNGGVLRIQTTPTNYSPATGTLTGGSWVVYSDSSVLLPAGVGIVNNAATVGISGQTATFPALTPIAFNSGSLTLLAGSDLAVQGSLTNTGTLVLSAGSTLSIGGNFSQSSAGSLRVEVNTNFTGAKLEAAGHASLSGAFMATPVSPFTPISSILIPFLTAAHIDGTFSSYSGSGFQDGRRLYPRYRTESVLVAVSPPYPSMPVLAPGQDTGISATDRITNVSSPTLVGTALDAAEVRMYLNGVLLGTGPVVSGNYSINISGLSQGTHNIRTVAVNAEGDASSESTINLTIDLTPPIPASVNFAFDANQPPHRLNITFDSFIYYNGLISKLVIENVTTGQTIPSSAIQVYGEDYLHAQLRFPGLPGGLLPDGNYRVSVLPGAVTDAAGNPSQAADLTFFVLTGDANRDRKVDFADLLILAQNFGQVNRSFSQGNFNYSEDGRVDFADLLMLAQRYGTGLSLNVSASLKRRNDKLVTDESAYIPPSTR